MALVDQPGPERVGREGRAADREAPLRGGLQLPHRLGVEASLDPRPAPSHQGLFRLVAAAGEGVFVDGPRDPARVVFEAGDVEGVPPRSITCLPDKPRRFEHLDVVGRQRLASLDPVAQSGERVRMTIQASQDVKPHWMLYHPPKLKGPFVAISLVFPACAGSACLRLAHSPKAKAVLSKDCFDFADRKLLRIVRLKHPWRRNGELERGHSRAICQKASARRVAHRDRLAGLADRYDRQRRGAR